MIADSLDLELPRQLAQEIAKSGQLPGGQTRETYMHFIIFCTDKENSEDLRMATREAHLGYLQNSDITLSFAGPYLSADGEHMIGSLLVVEADDLAAASAFAAGDPYGKAGLFADVRVHPWRWTIGNPNSE